MSVQHDATDYGKATALFGAGRFAEVRAALERCVAADPEHVGASFGLGACREALGDLDEAEALYRRTLQLDGTHLNASLHLARLLQRRGRAAEADEAFARVLALSPGHPEATAHQAQRAAPVPAQPQPAAAAPARSTLAADLDDGADQLAGAMAGKVLHSGRRRLLSHRRFWLGVVTLLLLPALAAVERSVTSSPPSGSSTVDDVVRTADGVLTALQVTVVVVAGLLVLAAALSSALTHYTVRERRIDIHRGVLFRSRRPVWLYDVNDIEFEQSPVLMLAGTAKVTLHVDEPNQKRRPPVVVGFGSASFLHRLVEELQPRILRERRAMKKQFT
jgi:tetratricopeptide (TPR) repeat protein